MTLSEIIKDYRKQHRMSQRQLAINSGLSNAYISMLESGINPNNGKPLVPSIPILKKLAVGMNSTIDELLQSADDLPINMDIHDTVEPSSSKETIALALKRLRIQSGLTADEVGAMVGKSGKTVNAWENNRGQPDAEMLIKLCDIYHVDDILEEFREEPKSKSFFLSDHEKELVIAYRNNVALQPAVDRILCIESENTVASDMESSLKKYGTESKKVSSSTK